MRFKSTTSTRPFYSAIHTPPPPPPPTSCARTLSSCMYVRFFPARPHPSQRAITETLSVDIRSLRKTQVAAAAPSCILLFDGLRVEFAATSARIAVPPAAPPPPGPGAGADSVAGSQAAAVSPASPAGKPRSASPVGGGVHDSASATVGGGGGGVHVGLKVSGLEAGKSVEGRVSPSAVVPLLSAVETVRVLSVEVGGRG